MSRDFFASALQEKDPDKRWEIIRQIQRGAERSDFEKAATLTKSNRYNEVVLGLDILAQMGQSENRPFEQETIEIFLELASKEKRAKVLTSLGYACGHLVPEDNHIFVDFLVSISQHASRFVRHAAIFGLLGHEDDRAIAALIQLCGDPDGNNRDWATFGVGSQIEADSGEIRQALFRNVDDDNITARREAILGLAIRKDPRVWENVLKELRSNEVGTLVIEAASELGDVRLHNALTELQQWWDVDEKLLMAAIENCSKDRSAPVFCAD